MKYYHCLVIPKQELEDNGINLPEFTNGHLKDKTAISIIEDYCNIPIVSIQQTSSDSDEILVLAADGYIQYNPLSNQRKVILRGDYEPLKGVLEDIYKERDSENPFDIYCSYIYQTPAAIQTKLQNWTRNEYKRPSK